jgi:hypothetical protein
VIALVANCLIIGVMAAAGALNFLDPDLYYRSVQEDEFVEWGSFWAFLVAGITFLALARQSALGQRPPWFALGVALFCLIVAMEEISWGQRILGYRPPQYFLANNFQQELNVHNVIATSQRKLLVHAVIIGFGIGLPALWAHPATRHLLVRYGVVSAPPALVPAFIATWAFYAWYPLTHSGEWVELMLGLGFLFSALWVLSVFTVSHRKDTREHRLAGRLTGGLLVVLLLSLSSTAASRQQRVGHADTVAAARIEIAALRNDFLSGRMRVRCGVHKRLYTYTEKYNQTHTRTGDFARLTMNGLPEARATYLLDPWNSPYWIRDICSEGAQKRIAFIYSFGPNRRRESTRLHILGDDVGEFILSPKTNDVSR